METPRIGFFGSGPFGRAILDGLTTTNLGTIVCCVTAPDRPVGRSLRLQPDDVAVRAGQINVLTIQPERLDLEFLEQFRSSNIDLAVVASYGKILPPELLAILPNRFINVHPSLLPKYRGASPVSAALLDGANESGTTLIIMDNGVDTGPILAQARVSIQPDWHRPDLESALAGLANQLVRETLPRFLRNEINPKMQPTARERPTKKLRRADGAINWTAPGEFIIRQFRAYDPWPGVWTTWAGRTVKLIDLALAEAVPKATPGTVQLDENRRLIVAAGEQGVEIRTLQLSGRDPVSAGEFIRGYPSILGSTFTSPSES